MNICKQMVLAAKVSNTELDKIKSLIALELNSESKAQQIIVDVFADSWESDWRVVELWATACELTTNQMMNLTEADAVIEGEANKSDKPKLVLIDKKMVVRMEDVPERAAKEISEMITSVFKRAEKQIDEQMASINKKHDLKMLGASHEIPGQVADFIAKAPKELQAALTLAFGHRMKQMKGGKMPCFCGKCTHK